MSRSFQKLFWGERPLADQSEVCWTVVWLKEKVVLATLAARAEVWPPEQGR